MKLKSLILGSVAAAGLSTAGFAADLGVLTSLDVCDELGLSGLTISSDENCLQISGEVKYEFNWGDYKGSELVAGTNTDSGYDPFNIIDNDAEIVVRLRLGAWIEIERGARVPARKRLAWASPLTGSFLLVGLAAESIGLAITPDALAEKLRREEARVLNGSPLVERTLASLVTRLSPQG